MKLAALLEDADYWRGPPPGEEPASYKEWQHFVVFGPDWMLLSNFSLDGAGGGRSIAIFSAEKWVGSIDRCARPVFRPARIDATFDDSSLSWRGGRYEIRRGGDDIRFEVSLEPAATPSLSHHIQLGAGSRLSWCLVPRLFASGWIEAGDRRLRFDRSIAYHDHNWGRFTWGGDFSWEWGCAVPDDPRSPWTVIFARMNDRARHVTTATSIFLLEGGRHLRYFRNSEAEFSTEGATGARPAGRAPAAAALLLPDEDLDVPRWTRFQAARGGDELRGEVEALRRGQILVPSERDVRDIVRLNEAETRVHIEGCCAGKRVEFSGRGLLEVVRG